MWSSWKRLLEDEDRKKSWSMRYVRVKSKSNRKCRKIRYSSRRRSIYIPTKNVHGRYRTFWNSQNKKCRRIDRSTRSKPGMIRKGWKDGNSYIQCRCSKKDDILGSTYMNKPNSNRKEASNIQRIRRETTDSRYCTR